MHSRPLYRPVAIETISRNSQNFLISGSVWTGDEFVIKKRRENMIEGELLISLRLQGRQQVQLIPLIRQIFRGKFVQISISKKAIG